jgi:hypothetical protein
VYAVELPTLRRPSRTSSIVEFCDVTDCTTVRIRPHFRPRHESSNAKPKQRRPADAATRLHSASMYKEPTEEKRDQPP